MNNPLAPFVLPDRLNHESYLHVFIQDLNELLEEVDVETRRYIFQNDGACHYVANVLVHLKRLFEDKWIAQGGPNRNYLT